jgi:hypothetical protein
MCAHRQTDRHLGNEHKSGRIMGFTIITVGRARIGESGGVRRKRRASKHQVTAGQLLAQARAEALRYCVTAETNAGGPQAVVVRRLLAACIRRPSLRALVWLRAARAPRRGWPLVARPRRPRRHRCGCGGRFGACWPRGQFDDEVALLLIHRSGGGLWQHHCGERAVAAALRKVVIRQQRSLELLRVDFKEVQMVRFLGSVFGRATLPLQASPSMAVARLRSPCARFTLRCAVILAAGTVLVGGFVTEVMLLLILRPERSRSLSTVAGLYLC